MHTHLQRQAQKSFLDLEISGEMPKDMFECTQRLSGTRTHRRKHIDLYLLTYIHTCIHTYIDRTRTYACMHTPTCVRT